MLRTARKAKGLTMKELGEKVGVSESAISQYENGKREADYDTILKISEILDCPVDYLLRGEDSKNHTNRIAELRKERKLTQQELSTIIGVAQNTICTWENGEQEPDYESLRKMAFFFHCSMDYLLGIVPFGYYFVFDEQTDPNLDWSGRPRIEGQEKRPTPVFEDGLDDEQKELIRLFETAPAAFRAAALALLRSAEAQSEVQGEVSKAE